MKKVEYNNFRGVHMGLSQQFRQDAKLVQPSTWQAVDVSKKPEMATHELEDIFFQYPMGSEDLLYHSSQIGPNLPWADDHFEQDRVSGEPLNPGYTWAQWPWANKADSFRDERGQFNHSYAERYWPKLAGKTAGGSFRGTIFDETCGDYQKSIEAKNLDAHYGIRYQYGDLNDVVDLLVRNPLTRNAYLPVWFPEDTGVVHGHRTPCTIGYLFRMRSDRLSIFYDIRSCDFIRHFQDDVYLSIRLALWVLNQCRARDDKWRSVKPGMFSMHIGSLHIFANDWQKFLENNS